MNTNQTPTILRRKEVETRTGLSSSTIYSKIRRNFKRPGDYDPSFPKPIQLGASSVGWVAQEVDAWIAAQMQKREAV